MSTVLNRLISYKDVPNSKTFKANLYQYYEMHNYTDICLRALSNKLDMPYEKIKEYLNDYIQRNMLMSEDEFKKYIKEKKSDKLKEEHNLEVARNRRNTDTKIKQCFRNIIDCNNISEIYEIVTQSGYTFSSLEHNFILYSEFFTENEKEMYYRKMKEYVKYHKKHIKELQEQKKMERLEKRLNELIEILDDYMAQGENMPLKTYLSENNITSGMFIKYLDTIKKHNPKKYDEYKIFEETKEKNKSANLARIAKEVGKYLEEGYEENGKHRNFDIIDYFLISKYKLYEVYAAGARVLPRNQIVLLKRFRLSNESADETNRADITAIQEERRMINVEFDENKKPIPNTGRWLTEDEKNNFVNYLKENKIPINRFTYRAVMKRYLNGYLSFEENKKLIKKNN